MTKKRKRAGAENEFDKFCDYAEVRGWTTTVRRFVEDETVLLQVIIHAHGVEMAAPSVLDVAELGPSTVGLREQLERDTA